jgi:tetrahedral aminopeptidase
MNIDSKKFLFKLLETPSPTGFEEKIQRVVKQRMQEYADSIETDLHGNLIVGLNTKARRRVMLAGHCDQIGFMVKYIDDKGYIYLEPLGGIDTGVLHGSYVTIYGKQGAVQGVIGKKAVHLMSPEERGKALVEWDKLWVDIGAKDQKDAQKRVNIADPVVYKPGVTELNENLIASPGLDNRVGLFVVMEALRLCARAKLNVALYSVSTVQEEIGLRGATTAANYLQPEIALAVDVTHASDNPGKNTDKLSPCLLGKGPAISRGPNTNPVLYKKLEAVAKSKRIPYQPYANANLLGNDARAIQVTGSGVATAALGIPNRYMHTQVEVCDLRDLEYSAKLLAELIKNINESTDFRPR